MPETWCENWFGFVNSCFYHAHQTREIYQVLPHSVVFKAPSIFDIHWVRQYLLNIVLFRMKDLKGVNICNDVKLKSKSYVGSVNIFPIFLHCKSQRWKTQSNCFYSQLGWHLRWLWNGYGMCDEHFDIIFAKKLLNMQCHLQDDIH